MIVLHPLHTPIQGGHHGAHSPISRRAVDLMGYRKRSTSPAGDKGPAGQGWGRLGCMDKQFTQIHTRSFSSGGQISEGILLYANVDRFPVSLRQLIPAGTIWLMRNNANMLLADNTGVIHRAAAGYNNPIVVVVVPARAFQQPRRLTITRCSSSSDQSQPGAQITTGTSTMVCH